MTLKDAVPVKSAVRVLDIFEFFAHQRAPATIQDVAAAQGYPHSSTTTLLNSLRDRGYLSYDPQAKTYVPTLRLVMLGRWMLEEPNRTFGVQRMQEQLQQLTGESVILASREGGMARYIQVLSSAAVVRLTVPSGTLRPLHRTAAGIMLLSTLEGDELQAALAASLEIEPIAARAEIHKAVEPAIVLAKRRGWTVSRGKMTTGAGVVATLLPDYPDADPMAVAIGAPLERLDEKLPDLLVALRDVVGSPSEIRPEDVAEATA